MFSCFQLLTLFRSEAVFNELIFLNSMTQIIRTFHSHFVSCEIKAASTDSTNIRKVSDQLGQRHGLIMVFVLWRQFLLSLASHKWEIGKQCKPRSDAASD